MKHPNVLAGSAATRLLGFCLPAHCGPIVCVTVQETPCQPLHLGSLYALWPIKAPIFANLLTPLHTLSM